MPSPPLPAPRRLESLLAGVAIALAGGLVLLPAAGCSSKTDKTEAAIKCVPGNPVFCRCKDREEGNKVCNEDGASFGKCEPCETFDNPEIPEEPYTPPDEVDGGGDGQAPGPGNCGDKIVQDGEDCDDGNKVNDDGCDDKCHVAGANPLASRSCPGLGVHVWANPVVYTGTTAGSPNNGTVSPACASSSGNPATGSTSADRIFNVTAHAKGMLTVAATENGYDVLLYASAKCVAGTMTSLTCSNKAAGTAGESISFPVEGGSSYAVVVDGVSAAQGAFKLSFSIKP